MINIAKLLEDAPEGMILYSPLFGEVKFKYINGSKFGIVVAASDGCCRSFDKYGRYFTLYNNAECLLFPSKDCRTWEGWKLPVETKFKVGDWVACIDDEGDMATEKIVTFLHNKVLLVDTDGCLAEYPKTELSNFHLWTIQDAKDGDVLCTYEGGNPKIVFILRGNPEGNCSVLSYYCYYNIMYPHFEPNAERGCLAPKREDVKPATKEQRDLLFAKMREAGYQWDEEKKELHKIQPHYDIKNFYAGMPVLVRADNNCRWDYSVFSRITGNKDWPFAVCNGVSFTQCIPFNDDTKHLLGTTDMCPEEYINW